MVSVNLTFVGLAAYYGVMAIGALVWVLVRTKHEKKKACPPPLKPPSSELQISTPSVAPVPGRRVAPL